jgi:hypothetical protein
LSATGQASAEDARAERSASEQVETERFEQAEVPVYRWRLNLVDWIVIGVVIAGLAGIIYWLRW